MKKFLAILALLVSTPAWGQSVSQSGSVTNGHAAAWISNGIIGDGGTAANGNLTSIGATNNGGPAICANSAKVGNPYNQLCLSVSTAGAAQISLQNFGGASAQGLNFVINGTTQGFQLGQDGSITSTGVTGGNKGPNTINVSGGVFVNGVAISAGSSVVSGLINQIAYYASTGTVLSGLATGNNGVLITSGAGAPSISSTIPTATQANITGTGTLTSGATGAGFTVALTTSTITGLLTGTNGGTGVNNGANTITLAGNLTHAGAFSTTITVTNTTNSTLPAGTHTLAGLDVAQSWTAIQTFTNSDIKLLGSSTGATTFTSANAGASNFTLTFPGVTDTLAVLGTAQTWTAAQTFTNSDILLLGSSTGATTFTSANAGASNFTLTFPAITSTVAVLGAAQTWTAAQTFTSGDLLLKGASSGTITLNAASAAGSNTITLPAGTTDFSATGGTSQVVKQTSSGGAFTVAQLACSDLSNAAAGCSNAAANPTGTVGLTTVNGSAATYMRSDGAPPLSQSIAPTWTGQHNWTIATTVTSASGAALDDLHVNAATTTITGTNTITRLSKITIDQPTLTNGSANVVTDAASVYITGAPIAAGSVTITNNWALLIAGGATKLQAVSINGLATLTNNLKLPNAGVIYPASDSTTALTIDKADGTTAFVTFDSSNKRVGINKTPGSFDLDVNGAVNFGSTATVTSTLTASAAVNITGLVTLSNNLKLPNAGVIYPTSDSTTALTIDKADGTTAFVTFDSSNKRVGINKTPGAFDFDVNGTVNVGTTLTFTTLSATSLGASTSTITGLTVNNSPSSSNDYLLYYSAGDGAIRKATVGSIAAAASGGVQNINGQCAGASCTISSGQGISVTTGTNTITITNTFSPTQPQGRLTLQTGVPVMLTTQSAKTTLYYDCYRGGNGVPYYNGASDVVDTITSCEISTAMVSAASAGQVVSGNVYDAWWVHGGANRICLAMSASGGGGGGWSSDTGGSNTARGTGYSQLDTTSRPYVTNKNTFSNCFNAATNYGPVTANQGTYLGTVYASANGQVSYTFGGSGVAGQLGVWNAYNRVRVTSTATESTTSYNYTTATMRQSQAQAYNQNSVVRGMELEAIYTVADSTWGNSTASVVAQAGIGQNGANTTNIATGYRIAQTVGTGGAYMSTSATYAGYPGVGYQTMARLEYSAASGTTTWYSGTGTNGVPLSGIMMEVFQ